MWKVKSFKTLEEMQEWIADNRNRYQIARIFVNNKPYTVEYKKLRFIG